MASEEHKVLADFIKNTHSNLRKESQIHGATVAWRKHVEQKEILLKYAVSMQQLATKYWAKNVADPTKQLQCRIQWIKKQCIEYFFNEGRERYQKRELDIELKLTAITTKKKDSCSLNMEKLFLLDVGSCYNPFENMDQFHVTAIDLIPYSQNVLQCDFLNLNIRGNRIVNEETKTITELPMNFFDVVIFSLFLEYLPCPKQRYLCCTKAYKLLKAGGILLIVTPDSKHVGANAKVMKSWRFVLANLGFMRIKYEKLPHMHCLIFRKCFSQHVARRWIQLQQLPSNDILFQSKFMLHIPQDFQESYTLNEYHKPDKSLNDCNDTAIMFEELPAA
ncbi:S-adenosylmethionine sensor upstream of mTORC1 [Cephus cinctus]|uniref:S-adenosylmethionine sensor upstream of mTORC1 n=1 Tax=Cephus cinctus TaxID=211228 RepID=A0AAJ7BTE3_CEPCN|nr:S-adenosylmethionine sensor upstream of mTORC1 [Cephus cinctus]